VADELGDGGLVLDHSVADPNNGERDLGARIHPAFTGCCVFGSRPSSWYVSIAR
jgi:hypothetical protein